MFDRNLTGALVKIFGYFDGNSRVSLIIVTASFSPPTSSQPPSLSSGAYFLRSRMATGRNPCIAFKKSSITKVGFTEFREALEGRTKREAAACTALSTKISKSYAS
uniref:Uncharacterized protein n=1 Tax=Arundo donax TaxID=35708 RepID=A0A0A9CXT8_ARUDO